MQQGYGQHLHAWMTMEHSDSNQAAQLHFC